MTTRKIIRRALWGGLMHHDQLCTECAGAGTYEPAEGEDEEPCDVCDGDGTVRWGSFYGRRGDCDVCDRENALVASMYEDCHGTEWVCLRCYLGHHRAQCGCDLWAKVEAAIRWPAEPAKAAS